MNERGEQPTEHGRGSILDKNYCWLGWLILLVIVLLDNLPLRLYCFFFLCLEACMCIICLIELQRVLRFTLQNIASWCRGILKCVSLPLKSCGAASRCASLRVFLKELVCLTGNIAFIAGAVVLIFTVTMVFDGKVVSWFAESWMPCFVELFSCLGLESVLCSVMSFCNRLLCSVLPASWHRMLVGHWPAIFVVGMLVFVGRTWLKNKVVCFRQKIKRLTQLMPSREPLIHYDYFDRPISASAEDKFNRMPFVFALWNRLREMNYSVESQCIGLFGRWGDGKTSVYNLLKEYCGKKSETSGVLFVEVDSWKMSRFADHPYVLFDSLAERLTTECPTLAKAFSRFTWGRAFRKSIADIETTNGWFACLSLCLGIVGRSEIELSGMLRRELISCGKRIVVVIDDLDRASSADVREILRIIKTHGSLPYVTYLLLADYDHIVDAIQESAPIHEDGMDKYGQYGRAYLEKIVNYHMELPKIKPIDIEKELRDGIRKELNNLHFDTEFLDKDELESVVPFVKNMRNVRRFMWRFRSLLMYMASKDSGHCFCLSDVIAVTGISVFAHRFYALLAEKGPMLFETRRIECEEIDELLKSEQPSASQPLRDFLIYRMGLRRIVREGGEETLYYRFERDRIAETQYRLMVPRFFASYFSVNDVSNELTPDERNKISEALKSPGGCEFEETLMTLHGVNKLKVFLNDVDLSVFDDSSLKVKSFVVGLSQVGDNFLFDANDEIKHWDMHWDDYHVYHTISNLVMKVSLERGLNGDQLMDLLKDSKLVRAFIVDNEVDVIMGRSYCPRVCSDRLLSRLEDGYIESLCSFKSSEEWQKCDKKLILERAWFRIIRHREDAGLQKAFVDAHKGDSDKFPACAVVMMLFKVFREISDPKRLVMIDLNGMLEYFEETFVRNLCNTMLDNSGQLTDQLMVITEALRFALEQKSTGKPYDFNAQREYLCSFLEKTPVSE